jgi:hypothetical protein
MLPSLLAREIQNGLKHFLTTGFEPSDPLFAGVMQRFTDDEGRWLKGPYIQIGLPFRTGTRGRTFFGSFETEFPATSIRKRRGNDWRVSSTPPGRWSPPAPAAARPSVFCTRCSITARAPAVTALRVSRRW